MTLIDLQGHLSYFRSLLESVDNLTKDDTVDDLD